ncbi:pilus assembly protein N-terminal domain-containing protein [Azoarcus sp. L1K30]|uniref:pilus assembly protein N-terminal domain-containing protein n=1 Tax=Azoarcus sp. L1K30 TaxID=2820277 RepID=UPI001B812343|nr:pilus assembly protein N-terminal domain-containing protein [Azoarcus sp. L1K30]MBR0567418.1 pilus assembly protein N-terminal domain-containing protein [Azoarcus sp. L1K30]
MQKMRSDPASISLRLAACLIFSSCVLPAVVCAQQGVPDSAPGSASLAPVGKFVETWHSGGNARTSKTAYAPIKATNDQGLIPEIDMFVGETRVFPAPGVARIAVGNGQIMNAASLDDKEVIVFANAVGTSSLFIWNEDGKYQRVKINIAPGDTSRFAREIAAFLAGIPHARASVIGDKVIVEGEELSDRDLGKIEELAKRYPQIVNFTNPDGWEKMVLMDVKVVEFPTNELKEIGLKWGPTGGAAIGGVWAPIVHGNDAYQINLATGTSNPAPITAVGGGSSMPLHTGVNILSVVNMGLNAQLALLAQEGKASILAQPQLSARSGSAAHFLAGGEFPYTVSTINGTTVNFKPYGVALDIEPTVSNSGNIRAKITSEVSNIDTSVSTVAGPALSKRMTQTEFNVRDGETLVLAGLLKRSDSSSIDKVPFLGDLPVIGALFRSRRFQNDETELVVFVTPHIVDSRSPGLVDRIDRASRRLEDGLGKPPYLNEPDERRAADPTKSIRPGDPEAPLMPPGDESLRDDVGGARGDARSASVIEINQRVIRDGVAVHALPNRASEVLVRLGKGAVVGSVSPEKLGGWRQVRLPDGNTGWIADHAIEPTTDAEWLMKAFTDRLPAARIASRPVTALPDAGGAPMAWYRVTGLKLALRVSPDRNAQRLAWLEIGSEVQALSRSPVDGWLPVQSGPHSGWAWAGLLEPVRAEVP